MTRRRIRALALGIGLVVGVGVPLAQIALDCRVRDSEACVWGRALWPVAVGAGAFLGLVGGTVAYFVLRSLLPPPPDD